MSLATYVDESIILLKRCYCVDDVARPVCGAMELGIAIPTPSNPNDWTATKQFVASVVRQLDIGRNGPSTQVGVAIYRGMYVMS